MGIGEVYMEKSSGSRTVLGTPTGHEVGGDECEPIWTDWVIPVR